MGDELTQLEERVTRKWAQAAASRMPESSFDASAWHDLDTEWGGTALNAPQFPREQWVSYPAKRTVSLMTCDRMLDFEELTDEQWMTLSFLMLYGGRERIA